MTTVDAWSDFWKQGFPTSYAGDLPDSYQGFIGDFWKNAAKQLQKNSKILDLATGNGALALLFASVSKKNQRDFEIHAIDSASISPSETNRNPSLAPLYSLINFHSNTRIEDFEQHSNQGFDLITSQFGIEYSDYETSIPAVASQLNSGGNLIVICHYSESETYKRCTEDLHAYNLAIDELKINQRISDILQNVGSIATVSELEAALLEENNQKRLDALVGAINSLRAKYPTSAVTAYFANNVNSFFSSRLISTMEDKVNFSQALTTGAELGRSRVEAQIGATLTPELVRRYEEVISRSGLSLSVSSAFLDKDEVIGWQFNAEKTL